MTASTWAWMDRAQCVVERCAVAPVPGVWAICQRCPVVGECVDWTEQSRARKPGTAGRPLGEIRHGTPSGYKQHHYRGEDACAECKAANSRYTSQRKAAGRKAAGS